MIPANTVLDECESTNDVARSLGEAGYPHGTWISCRSQRRGRGRLGRQWKSIEGNLFLSIVLRIEQKTLWSWVPLTVSLAVAKGLRELFPRLDIRIKWPNDLWIEQRKLGGILCEAVGGREQSFIIAGIGVNAAHAPDGLDQETASLRSSADEIRFPVIASVMECADLLKERGPDFIIPEYERLAALTRGTVIEWGDSRLGSIIGTIRGLGPFGELLVDTHTGEQKLFAEDVRIKIRRSAN
jgi:BirA family biotin operon repressor/biotin-[acetyl-CoA-carboxylase] ligase